MFLDNLSFRPELGLLMLVRLPAGDIKTTDSLHFDMHVRN